MLSKHLGCTLVTKVKPERGATKYYLRSKEPSVSLNKHEHYCLNNVRLDYRYRLSISIFKEMPLGVSFEKSHTIRTKCGTRQRAPALLKKG